MRPGSRGLASFLAAALIVPAVLPVPGRAADLVPYHASDWRYKQVAAGDPLEATFYQPNFDDSSWLVGAAAFGSGGGCPLDPMVQTGWSVGSDLLLRRTFVAGASSPVSVYVAIDNDVVVWVNGTLIMSQLHEACATLDSFTGVVPPGVIVEGANVIAVKGVDRGVVSFLDVRITGQLPTLVSSTSWARVKSIYR